MQTLEARRSERIEYHAEVELFSESGAPGKVLARARDLGVGGIQLSAEAETAIEIGALVTCRVPLDGELTELPGRVVWMHARSVEQHDDERALGIRFDAVGRRERALLQYVVRRAASGLRPVELFFDDLDKPVAAEGYPRPGGLRLSAALPLFERGRALSMKIDGRGPLLSARIGAASLIDDGGTPRLELDLEFQDGDLARTRRNARYGYAAELDAVPEQTQPEEVEPPSEARRARWPLVALALAAVAGSGLFATAQHLAQPALGPEFVARPGHRSVATAATEPAPQPAPELPRGAARPGLSAAALAATTSVVRETHVARGTNEKAESSKPTPGSEDTQSSEPARAPHRSDSTPAESDKAPLAPAASPQTAAPVPEPPVATEATRPADAHATQAPAPRIEVAVQGWTTWIKLPFAGALGGMRARVWADPQALAVDLPQGKSALAPGHYAVNQGRVTEVQIATRDEQLLVRVKASAPIVSYDVAAANGTLQLKLMLPSAAPAATPPATPPNAAP